MSIYRSHAPRAPRLRPLFPLLVALGAVLDVTHAGVPQPPCVFYGEARDAFGFPYVSGAEVILRVEGRVCSRWPIAGNLAPGVNFRLSLELDEGTTTPYASYAAHPGQTVTISVRAQGAERQIMETRALAVGEAGDMIGIYITSGTDADGDGLPDDWEQMLIDNSGGLLTNIEQVLPQDDFDDDGVSNLDENRAGTYAFLGDDYLQIEQMEALPNGKLRLQFLTTRGISYRIHGANQVGANVSWQPVPLALSDTAGAAPYGAVVGDGTFISVYVDTTESARFFRLTAE